MTRETYDRLWRTSFLPFARRLSTRFRRVAFRPTKKEIIWDRFQRAVDECRREELGRPTVLDRHKFAAMFTAIVLEVLPFRTASPHTSKKAKLDVGEFTANEAWAWHCSREMVLDMIAIYAVDENKEVLRLIYENGFRPPPCGHSSYDEQVVKSLYLARRRKSFDWHGYVHLLYMLEVYTAEARKDLLSGAVGA